MTRRERIWGLAWFIGILIVLAVNFSIAFVVTGWIYSLIGGPPSPLVVQVVNSMGGLVLAVLTVTAMARLFRSRIAAGETRLYGPIIEALERIAKGDFSVRVDSLDERQQSRGMLSNLVESVNQMAVELDQMENMRQEFISNVSHEIQSPLTSIRGFAEALQNDQLSAEERHAYLRIIEMESTRLSRLSDNLLRLASLESDQVKFEPKHYRLDKQIRNLILVSEPQWSAKGLEMDAALDSVEVTADEDLMSQVWINLIHNSIKFTPEHGTVKVTLQQQDGRIEFRITDSGPGISAEDQSRIFERFYKADRSRTHAKNGGSGLGLSIVHKIVTMHHGSVGVASRPGAGTTFTVSLPDGSRTEPQTAETAPQEREAAG